MAKINIIKQGRHYNFEVNGFKFQIFVDPWDENDVHPKDILVKELAEIIDLLQKQPNFVSNNFSIKDITEDISKKISDDSYKNEKV